MHMCEGQRAALCVSLSHCPSYSCEEDSPDLELGQQPSSPSIPMPPVSLGLVLQGVQDLAWVLGPHAYATSPLGH